MAKKTDAESPMAINLNLRATPELLTQIDEARAGMLKDESVGYIPSRSEFVRLAVEAYLDSPTSKGRPKAAVSSARGKR